MTDNNNKKNIPRSFICPLTLDVMYEPVIDGEGNTYEKQALLQWLVYYGQVSPISRQPLHPKHILPNYALRDIIHETMGKEWVQERRKEQVVATNANDVQVDQHQSQLLQQQQGEQQYYINLLTKQTGVQVLPPSFCKMNFFLQKLSEEVGGPGGMLLQLNDNGICMFNCENMTIVIEVPHSQPQPQTQVATNNNNIFFIYTMISVPTLTEETKDLLLELNLHHNETRKFINDTFIKVVELKVPKVPQGLIFFSQSFYFLICLDITGGGTLSVKKHDSGSYDIFFSYSDRLDEIAAGDFCNIVPNFIETASRLKAKFLSPMQQHQSFLSSNVVSSSSSSPQQPNHNSNTSEGMFATKFTS